MVFFARSIWNIRGVELDTPCVRVEINLLILLL